MCICFADDLKHPGSEEIKNKAELKAPHEIQTQSLLKIGISLQNFFCVFKNITHISKILSTLHFSTDMIVILTLYSILSKNH